MSRNKTGGREKGTFNKTTVILREKMTSLLDILIDEATTEEFIKGLKRNEHIELMSFLAKHTVPIPKEEKDESTEQVIVITGNLLK